MSDRPLVIDAASSMDEAAVVFKRGGVIAYPTETFYGLCVDPFNAWAVEKLFHLKGRSFHSPIAVIIGNIKMLGLVTGDVPPAAEKLIERFWPGPLTIIFNALPAIPPELIANTGKIGVRLSSHPTARALSNALASPITATSANPSDEPPPLTAENVLEYFDGSIDMLIDGGRLAGRLGSTMVDITGKEPAILRKGEIPSAEILDVLQK